MSNNRVIVLITSPFATNRAFLSQMLHKYLRLKGLDRVNIDNVPIVDLEPPCNVEKGQVIAGNSSFIISEHQMCRQIRMEPVEGELPFVCRPSVAQQFSGNDSGIAVIGAPNSGKSVVMKLIVECLNEAEVSRTRPQRIETLGDEPLPTAWMAEKYVDRLNEREIEVVFHVRRSITHATIDELLDSCDKPTDKTNE